MNCSARIVVWWLTLDAELELKVKIVRHANRTALEWSSKAWSCMYADVVTPLWEIIVDAHSKWLEAMFFFSSRLFQHAIKGVKTSVFVHGHLEIPSSSATMSVNGPSTEVPNPIIIFD